MNNIVLFLASVVLLSSVMGGCASPVSREYTNNLCSSEEKHAERVQLAEIMHDVERARIASDNNNYDLLKRLLRRIDGALQRIACFNFSDVLEELQKFQKLLDQHT